MVFGSEREKSPINFFLQVEKDDGNLCTIECSPLRLDRCNLLPTVDFSACHSKLMIR